MIFTTSSLHLVAQDTLPAQQVQTKKITDNQVQFQQQVQLDFTDRKEKIFPAISKVTNAKQDAMDELDEWFNKSLDSIENGTKKDMTLAQLEAKWKERQDEIDVNYHRSLEFLVAKNKRKRYRVFPSFNPYMSMLYYNSDKKFEFFQNINLSFGEDNRAFESEIVSGYLWAFRVSLSTVLATESTERLSPETLAGLSREQVDNLISENEKVNLANNTLLKVISGGGEANLNFKFPILNFWGNHVKNINLKSDLSGRLSGNLPLAGNSIPGSEVNFFTTIGFENYVIVPIRNFSIQKKQGFQTFAFFGRFDIKNVGGTSEFFNSLNIPSERFWYSGYSFGLTYSNLLIFYNNQTFHNSPLENNNKSRFGVGLIQQL